jgi:phosphoserine phosphatase
MPLRTKYPFVFFGVESTLVTIDGLDSLAGAAHEELPERLERLRPSRDAIARLAERYVTSITPGTPETLAALRAGGAHVQLVSCGILEALLPLAERLEVPARSVHAVSVMHDASGSYAGFDHRSLLLRPDGKELVVLSLLARSKGRSAFVGAGATDLATKKVVDFFVGFGGVRVDRQVEENAPVYVTGSALTAVLPYLMEEP